MRKVLCIYHGGGCRDGFTSAWVLNKFFANDKETEVKFEAALYAQEPPLDDAKGADVYVLDFSYSAKDMLRISEVARTVTLIDHHKTAIDALENVYIGANVTKILTTSGSGAGLTWDHLFAGIQAPLLVQYVEDRDLWKWKLMHSRSVSAAVFSYPMTFDSWDKMDAMTLEQLHAVGETLLRVKAQNTEAVVDVSCYVASVGGYDVPIINVPWLMGSEACELILKKYPDAPFAAYYRDSKNNRHWGLRSTDDRLDVSEIAKSFGGGGHRNAAGFVAPPVPPIKLTVTEKIREALESAL